MVTDYKSWQRIINCGNELYIVGTNYISWVRIINHGLMLGHRLRRWPNIKPALDEGDRSIFCSIHRRCEHRPKTQESNNQTRCDSREQQPQGVTQENNNHKVRLKTATTKQCATQESNNHKVRLKRAKTKQGATQESKNYSVRPKRATTTTCD